MTSGTAPVIDSELDLLFKQSNAATVTQVQAEEIISQLTKKPDVAAIIEASSGTGSNKDVAEEDDEKNITRKQRKELLSDPKEKEERTLFLGNLPVSCATDKMMIKTLKARFTPYGTVESIRFRSIPFAEPQARRVSFIKKNFRKDGTGGTCNGYIVMKTPEAAIAALKENATIFADRHLRVDLACEGEGSSKTNTKKSVFIGNLSMDLEEEPVWQLFGKCGAITNVRLIRDKVSNLGKGIGYVTFSSKDSVNVALKLAGTMLGGRPIRVSPCSKIGMVEKKKVRANNLAEKRQKLASALVKTNPSTGNATLGAAKAASTDAPVNKDIPTAKVSKKEAKLQAEMQTKFGQLFHKKFPFSQAISEVETNKKPSSKKSEPISKPSEKIKTRKTEAVSKPSEKTKTKAFPPKPTKIILPTARVEKASKIETKKPSKKYVKSE